MRQYKIWNAVSAVGGKKSSSDFGANESFNQRVFVGTSSRNSHLFADIEVIRGTDGTFGLYLDGELVKSARLEDGELVQG